MNTRNSCYTYFRIVGDFNPDEISEILNLTPEKTWKIGDLRCDGTKHVFAHWEIGRCSEYDVVTENQMRKTISLLQDKTHLLNQIREKYDVSFFLEVVPRIFAGEITPTLSPSLDVIDFCHETRTELDVDMYIFGSDDE